MSRIDRFLLSQEWEDHLGGVTQLVFPRLIFDYCPIKLCSKSLDWGPRLFRFNNGWLHKKGFLDLARS